MDDRSGTFRTSHRPARFGVPIAIVGLAVSMPLALAGQPAVASAPRAMTAARQCERADAWLRCVSEAAKRLCGSQVDALCVSGGPIESDAAPSTASINPADEHAAQRLLLPARLLDLPPPAC